MTVPRATMRLQFHRGFTFADAVPLVGYFAALGISHLYASPIMTARPGSMHGYDVIAPTCVNPELGGEEGFLRLVQELRQHEMGIIIDIVPNHMAVGAGNPWWMDVLAGGRSSRYAKFFDIDWEPDDPQLRGKVLLPILGRPYGEALAAGEIRLRQGQDASDAFVCYFDHVFPIAGADAHLVMHAPPEVFDPALSNGRERLHELLEEQHYRLAWWRSANDEINWRRFFDINELAALRMEDDEVFETVHAKVFELYSRGLIDGVRVDHIDGLAQPGEYCRKLRARLRELQVARPAGAPNNDAYFVVEKILSRHEELPRAWETNGTTGYDFMDEVNALQHDSAGEVPLTRLWQRISGHAGDFDAEEEAARRQILERSFSAQRESTVQAFLRVLQGDLATRDISRAAIRRCLTEILAQFRVYRIYARVDQASQADLTFLSQAVARAMETCLPVDRWLVEKLGKWLGGQCIHADAEQTQNVALARFQQLSAPLCAKAVEDTAFYRYGRLISRNDVGFDIRRFNCSASEFHQKMLERRLNFSHAMLSTATHDHKRGEDVRARLAVLSEFGPEWSEAVDRWIAATSAWGEGMAMPSPSDLAILFQTVVGAWPMTLFTADPAALAIFAERIAAWQQKALREAKLHSDWAAPNDEYERAAAGFVKRLFSGPSDILNEIASFAHRVAPAGALNGLAQVLLKLTAPGVPDIYQGTEYWDLSLVDPDNRAPVDFAVRQKSMRPYLFDELAQMWTDGRIKQFIIARLLAVRKKQPGVFAAGDYLPLEVRGPMSEHVIAFARSLHGFCAITVICRSIAGFLSADHTLNMPDSHWQDTRLCFPPELRGRFSDALRPYRIHSFDSQIRANELLGDFPIAFMTNYSASH
jgi:(1->4)-alpha-D-glucan 1-alpha-D-glucosylmutase